MLMDESDAALVARGLAGDRAAFEQLIARHRPQAVRLAARLLGDEADAEDAAQEASLTAYQNLARLRQPDRFAAWWFATVLNLGRMRLRARRPTVSLELAPDGQRAGNQPWAEAQPSPEMLAEARELTERVSDAIGDLPVAQRAAVRGFYWEGLSLAELSTQAGVPVGTIKARLSRARDRLRGALAGEVAPVVANRVEEVTMLSVTVQDVLGWMPPGNTDYWAIDPVRRVVLLANGASDQMVPIYMGGFEGEAIALGLLGKSFPRPMTFEFAARLLTAAGAVVQHVAVTRLVDNTFFATVWLRSVDGQVHELDARPSDALALAVRVGAPIFMDAAVIPEAEVVGPATVAGWATTPDEHGRALQSVLELTRARER
jgi:RNA polymerase sigma-70 factor (ECF subfamily)